MNKRLVISLAALLGWLLITVVAGQIRSGGHGQLSDAVSRGLGWPFLLAVLFLLAVVAWQCWRDIGLNTCASTSGCHVTLRAEPSTASAPLARTPAHAACLRNLGCRGGLTFEEFTTRSAEDQRRRAVENPRWCKVDYRGTVGWVAGRYLAEDACSASTTPGPSR